MAFVGRKQELALLNRFIKRKTAFLLVVRGRRRIGKSRLIEEFANLTDFIASSGLHQPTRHLVKHNEMSLPVNLQDRVFRVLKPRTGMNSFGCLPKKLKKVR